MRTPGSDAAGIFLSVGGAVGEGRPVLPLSLACARAWGPQFCGRRSASAPGPAVRSPSDLNGAHSRGGLDGDGSQVPDRGQTLGTNVGDFSSVATSAAPTRAPGAMRVGPFGRSCHYSISLAGVKATFAPLAFFELAGGLRPPFCTWREQTQLSGGAIPVFKFWFPCFTGGWGRQKSPFFYAPLQGRNCTASRLAVTKPFSIFSLLLGPGITFWPIW